jgi:hypothetical protein
MMLSLLAEPGAWLGRAGLLLMQQPGHLKAGYRLTCHQAVPAGAVGLLLLGLQQQRLDQHRENAKRTRKQQQQLSNMRNIRMLATRTTVLQQQLLQMQMLMKMTAREAAAAAVSGDGGRGKRRSGEERAKAACGAVQLLHQSRMKMLQPAAAMVVGTLMSMR